MKTTLRYRVAMLTILVDCLAASSQTQPNIYLPAPAASSQAQPKVFVDAEPQFSTAIAAAIEKKHVSITVVLDSKMADYVLKSAPVNSKDESGAGKIARCMFLNCLGINGNSTVSVALVRSSDSAVVWAYQVRKANSGPLGIQSLSEAIAKHLKNDYLHQEKY